MAGWEHDGKADWEDPQCGQFDSLEPWVDSLLDDAAVKDALGLLTGVDAEERLAEAGFLEHPAAGAGPPVQHLGGTAPGGLPAHQLPSLPFQQPLPPQQQPQLQQQELEQLEQLALVQLQGPEALLVGACSAQGRPAAFRLPPLVPGIAPAAPSECPQQQGVQREDWQPGALPSNASPSWANVQCRALPPLAAVVPMHAPLGVAAGGGMAATEASSAHPATVSSGVRLGWQSMGWEGAGAATAAATAAQEDLDRKADRLARTREKARLRKIKQREAMEQAEAEAALLRAEVEREQREQRGLKTEGCMYRSLLSYQQELQAAMEAAQEEGQEEEQHVLVFPAEVVALMRELDVENSEMLTFDDIIRYPVAGYKGNVGPDGRVRCPPPFEMVMQDWEQIASGVGALLKEAREAGRRMAGKLGERAALHVRSVQVPQEGVGWETIAQHAQQHSLRQHIWRTRQAMTTGEQGTEGVGAEGARARKGAGGSSSTCSEASSAPVELAGGMASRGAAAAAGRGISGDAEAAAGSEPEAAEAAASEAAAAAPEGDASSTRASSSQGSSKSGSLEEQEALAVAAATATMEAARVPLGSTGWEEGDEGAPAPAAACVSYDAADAAALVRRQLVVAAMLGCKPWSLVDGGVLIWQDEGAYYLRGEQLKRATWLLRRAGALLWQLALLAPDVFRRLVSERLVPAGVPPPAEEEGSIGSTSGGGGGGGEEAAAHWQRVLDAMQLNPLQLQELARLHQEYVTRVEQARERRMEAVDRIQEITLHMSCLQLRPAQQQARESLEIKGAADILNQAASAEFMAYARLLSAVYRVLHYPVQKMKFMALSWPYFSQVDRISAAAAARAAQAP